MLVELFVGLFLILVIGMGAGVGGVRVDYLSSGKVCYGCIQYHADDGWNERGKLG